MLNSSEDFVLDGSVKIQVKHTQTPAGSCKREISELLRKKPEKMESVVRIKNTDDLCMVLLLVVGKAAADEEANWYGRLIWAERLQTQRTRS